MVEGIMLDEFTLFIIGYHLPIMDAPFSLLHTEPVFLCPVDDGG